VAGVGARIARLRAHEGKEKHTFGLLGSRRGILLARKLAIDPAMRCFLPIYSRYMLTFLPFKMGSVQPVCDVGTVCLTEFRKRRILPPSPNTSLIL